MASIHGFKNGVISGPPMQCCYSCPLDGAFVPTTQGLLYTGGKCAENLYELRGDSIQSLEWFKLDEKLSSYPETDIVAFPLPTELELICT